MLHASEIAILILISRNSPYDIFKESIRAGWMSTFRDKGHPIFFYEGDGKGLLNNDTFELATSDGAKNLAKKTRLALDFLLKIHPNVKLIYRTNASSYLEYKNFFRFAQAIVNPSNAYIGVPGKTYLSNEILFFTDFTKFKRILSLVKIGSVEFCSGSGFFLGVNHAKKVAAQKYLDFMVDDVMVSLATKASPNKGLPVNLRPTRFDIMEKGMHKVTEQEYGFLLDSLLFHYRFKTCDRLQDAENIKRFHSDAFRLDFCTKQNDI